MSLELRKLRIIEILLKHGESILDDEGVDQAVCAKIADEILAEMESEALA